MNRSIIIALLVATIATTTTIVSAQTKITFGQLQQFNFTAPNVGDNMTLLLESSPPAFFGLLVPCFGAVNLFVGVNRVPTPSANDRADYWDPNTLGSSFQFPNTNPGYVSSLVQANESYADRPISFQFMIAASNEDIYNKFPTPGNSGKIELSLSNGGKSATVKFTSTGSPNDTYAIYMFDGKLPKGAFPFSACGVRQLSPTPVANPTIIDQGNNVNLATFNGLNPKTPTGISVVVTNQLGFSTSYTYGILNSSSSFIQAAPMLIVSLIALVLFM
ncbi:hypothetical protein SAMD00019534_106220 [Acytostelium subglobosum LB1]|uniref:hypothetical protein n=1 Tax=Acytostelium subglobosum LB1 TaxID=1410327 RepID=UPI000644AF7D|nr:hypothetical protein SAMD00019534_106220 [Acytostelium subglobosum LB1]GAM27446.1 hypothetical protein SAMD00019534_106220 [Acytostelium subglobosum LB1]|eukprot:XP_012749511.1 hypothetical protein SAMD00019534_106220 [Acytostelium subglobosum LB1]